MNESKNTRRPGFKKTLFVLLFFTCLFLTYDIFPQDTTDISIKAVSRANKTKIGIGEPFVHNTNIISGHDIVIDLPSEPNIGPFEVRKSGVIRKKHFNGYRIQLWHELITYETGKKTIPALVIEYRLADGQLNYIKSNAVNIYVQSVFERSKIESDIRPIEPPVGVKFPYTFHIIISLVLVLFFIFFLPILIRKRRIMLEKRRRGPADNILAHRKLSYELNALQKKPEFTKEDFVRLSGLLKEYIGFNFNIAFKKLTTEEFLYDLSQRNDFYSKYGEGLSFVLRLCDMAKFANHNPQAEEFKRLFLLSESVKDKVLPEQTEE
jgi:hypothetical protein